MYASHNYTAFMPFNNHSFSKNRATCTQIRSRSKAASFYIQLDKIAITESYFFYDRQGRQYTNNTINGISSVLNDDIHTCYEMIRADFGVFGRWFLCVDICQPNVPALGWQILRVCSLVIDHGWNRKERCPGPCTIGPVRAPIHKASVRHSYGLLLAGHGFFCSIGLIHK